VMNRMVDEGRFGDERALRVLLAAYSAVS
jgi:hypothetical protein